MRLPKSAVLSASLLPLILFSAASQRGCWLTSTTVQCEQVQCPYCPGETLLDAHGCSTCQCPSLACAGGASCTRATCLKDAECRDGHSCQADPTDPCNGDAGAACFAPGRHLCMPAPRACRAEPAYRAAYQGDRREVTKGLLDGQCKVQRTCGSLTLVDCDSAADGPAYYLESATGCVLERCGGACMAPGSSGQCVACPPPEWNCGP